MPKRLTKEIFIERSIACHGDKYGYDKVDYVNSDTDVQIYCRKCKEYFPQRPVHHSRGVGCPNEGGSKKLTHSEFLERSRKLYGSKYTILSKYINSTTNVSIKCNTCKSIFPIPPKRHYKGKGGCRRCNGGTFLKKEWFVERALRVHHRNEYDYSDFIYVKSGVRGMIFCKKCNEHFPQTPGDHLSGCGCPKHYSSVGEMLVEGVLKDLSITYEPEYKIEECRNTQKLPFDFAVFGNNGDLKGLIEFHGGQHYEFSDYFDKTYDKFLDRQRNDQIKADFCNVNRIPFCVIPYTELKNSEQIIKSFIRRIKSKESITNFKKPIQSNIFQHHDR